jgi:hypothetical protein
LRHGVGRPAVIAVSVDADGKRFFVRRMLPNCNSKPHRCAWKHLYSNTPGLPGCHPAGVRRRLQSDKVPEKQSS